MKAIEYLILRVGLTFLFLLASTPLLLILHYLSSIVEAHRNWWPVEVLGLIAAIGWLFSLGWMVRQTAEKMAFENRTLVEAIRSSLSEARVYCSLLPVVGRFFRLDSDEDGPRQD